MDKHTQKEKPNTNYDVKGLQRLANAVVLVAVEDYRIALRHPYAEGSRKTIRQCEQFFNSKYFALLTQLDPRYLLKKLHDEVKNK